MFTMLLLLAVVLSAVNGHQVCYPPYGCFTDEVPFDRTLVFLPRPPADINTKFILHTRASWHADYRIPFYLDPLSEWRVRSAGFNGTKQTVFLVHGYIESQEQWYVNMFYDEILKYGDVNAIFVDWSRGAAFPYHQATGDTRVVGAQLGHLVELLHNITGLPYSKVHLIGFSLGAHVAGYAGDYVRRRGNLIGRITGLDPAAPYFEYTDPEVRLDPTDAEFVDVIHSDSKTILIKGFGVEQAIGHVDFYPNGGFHQPGCEKLDLDLLQYLACSHYRAVRYFLESINTPCPYRAYPCESYSKFKKGLCTKCPSTGCPQLGIQAVKSKGIPQGRYYLLTTDKFPFCSYHYSVTFYTSDKLLSDLSGEVRLEITGTKGTAVTKVESSYYPGGSTEYRLAITDKDVGAIRRVKVNHDRLLDVWHLTGVVIKPMWSSNSHAACFNRWISNSFEEAMVAGSSIAPCVSMSSPAGEKPDAKPEKIEGRYNIPRRKTALTMKSYATI